MDFLRNKALELIVPFILGPVAFQAVQFLKRGDSWLSKQHASVKIGAAFAVSALVVAVAAFAGVDAPVCAAAQSCGLGDLNEEIVKAALGAGVAVLLHNQKKRSPSAQ